MISKKLQILVSIGIAFMVNAQDVFKVLASKGGSTVKSASSPEWKKALVGGKIQQADIIKLNANDYLGLIHIATGKTLELKTAGSYNAKDLAKKVATTGNSYSQKYAEYVMDAMANNASGTNNSVGGVVYRDPPVDVNIDYPKDNLVSVSSKVFDLGWHKTDYITVYEIVIQNMFDEVVLRQETKDTTARIDLSKVNLGDENRIKIKVKPKFDKEAKFKFDKEFTFVIDESKDYAKKRDEFLSEVKDETALNYLIQAKFYEDNKMFVDAVAAYDKAIKLEPKIEEFKLLKEEYLLKTGAKKKEDNSDKK